jgi:hypothetical protein
MRQRNNGQESGFCNLAGFLGPFKTLPSWRCNLAVQPKSLTGNETEHIVARSGISE